MDDLNDKSFVAGVISGDAEAFSSLFSRLLPKLCDFLSRSFELSREDAEEIAADVMLKVHGAVRRFDPKRGCKLRTWIFQIAKNTAIDHHRKRQCDTIIREIPTGNERALERSSLKSAQGQIWQQNQSNLQATTSSDKRSDETDASMERVRLRRCLDSLDENDRNVLLMKNIMTYEEIAASEGCTEGALRVRHLRAIQRLATAYNLEENR